ncbi:hypothetical protein [Nostoc sp.]|uniref:hypothetical protein n=1 Tax=Nostoc sp. TaxID=1180 RepID=UPI002FFC1D61
MPLEQITRALTLRGTILYHLEAIAVTSLPRGDVSCLHTYQPRRTMIFTVEQLIHKLRQHPGHCPVRVNDNECRDEEISEVFLSPDNTVILQVNSFFVRDSTDDSTVEFDLSDIQSPVTNR